MKLILIFALAMLTSCAIDQTNTQSVSVEGKFIDVVEFHPSTGEGRTIPELEFRLEPDKDIYPDGNVTEFLQSILHNIEQQWSGSRPENVKLVVTVDPLYHAASSADTVVMTMGVLKDATSVDEIAFLIAHEYAHIVLDHQDSFRLMNSQKALVSQAVDLGVMARRFSDAKYDDNKDVAYYKEDARRDENIDKAYQAGFVLNRLNRDVLRPSFGREDEREADHLAIDLMVRANYSPTAYKTVLERVKSTRVNKEHQLKAKQQEFSSYIDLISDDGEALKESKLGEVGYLVANKAVSHLLESVSHDHPDEDERMVALAEYMKREYRRERNRTLDTQGLASIKKDPQFRSYLLATDAYSRLELGELKQAEQLARQSVSGKQKSEFYPRMIFAKVRSLQNENRKSVTNLERVGSWQGASVQNYLFASRTYRDNKQYSNALEILDLAVANIGSDSPFYAERIAVYDSKNDQTMVNKLLEVCTQVEQENIVAQCYDSANMKAPINLDEASEVDEVVKDIKSVFSLFE